MILLAILAAAVTDNPDWEFAKNCVKDQTVYLEKSGESPTDVAKAAVQECRTKINTALPSNPLMTPEQNANIRQRFVDIFLNVSASNVVKIRACRKTPSCQPAKAYTFE